MNDSLEIVRRITELEKTLEKIQTYETGLLNNHSATGAPTINDDSGDGYSVGSIWVNVTLDDAYICCDATAGAAVWKKITP